MPANRTTNATEPREVKVKINGEVCYGQIEREGAARGGWRYRGDIEQCHDCGGDSFRVVDDPDQLRSGLGHMTGLALHCEGCGTTYGIQSDE